MSSETLGDRHPAAAEIQKQVDGGLPVALGVPGIPECQIRVFPTDRVVEILVRGDLTKPSVDKLARLRSSTRTLEGDEWGSLTIEWAQSPIEAYLFACAVTDRVQLQRDPLATAVDIVLREMRDIFRLQDALPREAEIGLFGELIVLLSLPSNRSLSALIDAWQGAQSEEHDFTLSDVDLEVKTTSAEERTHVISSLWQLEPVPGRQLRLVSIQVTPKTGQSSLTLPELVEIVLTRAGSRGSDLVEKLERVGYLIQDQDLYRTAWALRDSILEFVVDASFPKLTPSELQTLTVGANFISDVRYRIKLSGIDSCVDTRGRYPASLDLLA